MNAEVVDPVEALTCQPGQKVQRQVRYGRTADGLEQQFPVIVIAGQKAGPTGLFISGVHGDEYEGPAALWGLAEKLNPSELKGRVVIVPVANGAAFAAGTRTSPIDGENLARIFPGRENGSLSHQLANAISKHILPGVDFLIDSHSGGVRLAFVPVAGFYDDVSIAPATAQRSLFLAKAMGLRFLWQLPPVAGVLSYEAAKLGIPVCGAEVGGRGNCRPEDAADYLGAYLSVLAHNRMIDGAFKRPLASACLEGDWEKTSVGGYLETQIELGTTVGMGTVIALLRDMLGEVLHTFAAPMDGRVMAVRHLNTVQPGDLAICVVRETTR
jgi:N-alpha-acetyl-L-2,4-diaminobutyrate deacetylase